eukprot:381389-Pyramimonas_sp.AAC.1
MAANSAAAVVSSVCFAVSCSCSVSTCVLRSLCSRGLGPWRSKARRSMCHQGSEQHVHVLLHLPAAFWLRAPPRSPQEAADGAERQGPYAHGQRHRAHLDL